MRISNATLLLLQSSRTTARIRLQETCVKVATLYKDECPPEEIKERIREIAFNAIVESAIYEDLNPADRAFGGFKKIMYGLPTIFSRLRPVIFLTYLYVFCILQQYRSMSKRNPFVRDVYTCSYQFKCGCYCALLVKMYADKG